MLHKEDKNAPFTSKTERYTALFGSEDTLAGARKLKGRRFDLFCGQGKAKGLPLKIDRSANVCQCECLHICSSVSIQHCQRCTIISQ